MVVLRKELRHAFDHPAPSCVVLRRPASSRAQVVLGTGDVVPADLRLFEAKDFKVSEMALTGTTWGHSAGTDVQSADRVQRSG